MLPSSCRVKLNREVLDDVIRLKLVPRRRRVPTSLENVTCNSPKQEETLLVSGPASVNDTVRGGDEPVQTFLADPESVASDTRESCVGTQEAMRKKRDDVELKQMGPPRTTDIDTPLSPTGLAGSEVSLRRAVRPSGCGLCGDCKYVSPQRKTSGKQRPKSSNPGPQRPTFEVKITDENRGTEATQKISARTDVHPKVTLCDVAQKCDAFCQDCGYMLPDDLQTKVVHCFKREMRARFRVLSGCSGHSKHDGEGRGALDKNGEICPRFQSEGSVCQSPSLTGHQRHLKERTDAPKSFSDTTHCFLNSTTGESSATCSASFLLGKRAKKGECRTGLWDRDVGVDPGPGSHLLGVDIHTEKRKKQGDGVNYDILPTASDLECINCKSPEKNDTSRDREESCVWMSDDCQSCSEHSVGGSSFASAVKGSGIYKNARGEIDSPINADAASSQLCQGNRMGTDELESCSCQRVRAYFWKNNFSCARTCISWPFSSRGGASTAHAGTAVHPAEPIGPSDIGDPTSDTLPNAPTDPPSNPTHQASPRNHKKRQKDAQSVLAERNGTSNESVSSHSPDNTHTFLPHLTAAEESLEGPSSDVTTFSNPDQHGGEPSFPVDRSQTKSSTSDWETATTLSCMSTPLTPDGLSSLSATPSSLPPPSFLLRTSKSVELMSCSGETQTTSCSSSSSFPSHVYETTQTRDSPLLLFQDKPESDEDVFTGKYPPKVEQRYNASPINFLKEKTLHNTIAEECVDFNFVLPPMLSPLTSPQGCSHTSIPPQSPGCSDVEEEEEEEGNKSAFQHKMSPGCRMPQIVDINNEKSRDSFEHGIEELEEVSSLFKRPVGLSEQLSPSNHTDVVEEESQDETDCEGDVEKDYKKSEPVPLDPKLKATLTSDVLTEPHSSPSTEEDGEPLIDESRSCSGGAEGSSPSESTGSERDQSKAGGADNTPQGILNEFTAYEQDILLVDVSQDDPELFEIPNQQSLLKLAPTRFTEAPKTRPGTVKRLFPRIAGPSPPIEQRSSPVNIDFLGSIADFNEENEDRPWRPQCQHTFTKAQSSTWPATENQTNNMERPDANYSHVNKSLESRIQPIKTITSLPNHIRPVKTIKNGPWIKSQVNVAEFSRQKANMYCRLYFSETLSCGFKMCRFQHVPVEGDEKFCTETVARFSKNPICLQKAGAVFTGYYHNNPPGVYFSMPLLLSLLWSLLKAGLISDVFTVLRVSSAHKIVPGHEFLLAVFNYVREKELMGLVPELMQLTFKLANAGLVLSVDCLDCVKNTPEVQQTVCPNPASGKLSTSTPFPEYLNLAQAVVEIELCSKQEDWRRMGEVFRSICQSSQHPILVEQISGRIAIALLSESKDKLSLPFAAFAETVCQNDDGMVRSFLGRIGVSLMLRYHKTHQWFKGKRVVDVLYVSKVSYATLKGLFGNEDRASRCDLVTVATELFLLSGSVEGALNTLRENKWFLSSCLWPCEPADLESRTRVLMRLAEKTSHRDTLEVLCNLPGLKEPNDSFDISQHCPRFNCHLQLCLDRQTLPVASDTVDFMLSKNLAVDHDMLQTLLRKLGKQNLWLRAREVFRHSLSVGYYPGVSAPPGFMTLIVPCRLGEVELALTYEMFITVNATVIVRLPETTTCCLAITLKRTQSCESEYLSAGSRLLSAACIPQPRLIVHYKAVNSSGEQVFTLDIPSARCWLRHNHLWANEVWTH